MAGKSVAKMEIFDAVGTQYFHTGLEDVAK